MAGQGNLFLDIDREPERQGARPSGVGSAGQGTHSPLWPAQAAMPPRAAGIGEAPLGSVPQSAGADIAGISATGPQAAMPGGAMGHGPQELAAGLAALGASGSRLRPISLAAALAAIRSDESAAGGEPALPGPSPAGRMPALQGAGGEPALPVWERDTQELVDDWLVAGGIQRVNAALLDEASGSDDGYLERVYDFTRPEIAKLYDRTVVPLWSTPFGRMLLTMFLACPRHAGWQVVDVACGTGYPTLELAQLLGPDGDVAGIDLWSAGIERARKKAEALRLKNVAFLVADIARCDLPEHSFDAAICNLGLTNFVHPEAALRGMARLLQPNGTLILTSNLQGTMLEFFEVYQAVLNDLGLVNLSQNVERMLGMQPTIEAVEGLLERVGFTVDQTISDHFALEFPDGSTFLRSPLVGMGFLKSWRNLVSDLALRQVIFNEIERRLNARAGAWGRLDLTVPMLCLMARRRAEEE
jgi:arsenite methyltransferase